MEAVDSRTMHVLIRDKDAPNWQDHTWKVAKVRPDGNRVVVTYTNGKQYPYGEDRVRLYDQVERRKVDASMRSGCAGSAGTTSRSSGRFAARVTRVIRATRWRIEKLTASSRFGATEATR